MSPLAGPGSARGPHLDIDLDIDLEISTEHADGSTAVVRVRGRGRQVVVALAPDGAASPPRSGVGVDWAGVRALADLLADHGVALHVERHGRRLLTLGGGDRGGVWRLPGLPPVRAGRRGSSRQPGRTLPMKPTRALIHSPGRWTSLSSLPTCTRHSPSSASILEALLAQVGEHVIGIAQRD